MRRHTRHLIAAVCAATALLAAPAAYADPVSDCADNGQLDGRYTNDELRAALGNIPADLDEYSECRAIIGGAITRGGGKGPKAGVSNNPAAGSTQAVVAAKAKAAKAKKARRERRRLSALAVAAAPESASRGVAFEPDTSNDMPTGLLLALVALGLLALAGGVTTLSRRVPAFGENLRRLRRPFRRR